MDKTNSKSTERKKRIRVAKHGKDTPTNSKNRTNHRNKMKQTKPKTGIAMRIPTTLVPEIQKMASEYKFKNTKVKKTKTKKGLIDYGRIMRIPQAILKDVEKIIEDHKQAKKQHD